MLLMIGWHAEVRMTAGQTNCCPRADVELSNPLPTKGSGPGGIMIMDVRTCDRL